MLNNAIKYGGTKLKVGYTIDKNDSSHKFTIQDNGIGISPKYQKYIRGAFEYIMNKLLFLCGWVFSTYGEFLKKIYFNQNMKAFVLFLSVVLS